MPFSGAILSIITWLPAFGALVLRLGASALEKQSC